MLAQFTPPAFKRATVASLAIIMALALVACGTAVEPDATDVESEPEGAIQVTDVILASTTSTDDSGLFAELIPAFEDAYPQYKVSVVAVGTGQALEIGRAKDADVLLVHAKDDEETFVEEGFGIERRDVMYNDFVIVGPPTDPAGIKGSQDAAASMKAIADGGFGFASRGDDSGTHKKELKLWEGAGIERSGDWYDSIGQGMGDTLTFASEKESYTIADRATYLSMRDKLDLEIVIEGDTALFNQYGIIVVADASNANGARAFADWVVSAEGQAVIAEFGVAEYGEPLFIPNAQ